MLYRDEPHPAHAGFANAIDADLLSLNEYSLDQLGLRYSIPEEILNGLRIPKYDVYIAEGTRALYGSLLAQIKNNSTLIYLAGDMSLYKLSDSTYEAESKINWIISQFGMNIMKTIFDRYIDGCIAVSQLSKQSTASIINTQNIRVANPYIQPNLYKKLGSVSPEIQSKTVITVGTYSRYKGQELLVNAWERVRAEHPDATLHLVGKNYPDSFEQVPGVKVHGYVEDLPKALARSSLYVQSSRVDAFGVSVLEALQTGLPAIVTRTTGSSTVIKRLSNEMVVEPSSDAIASGINRYLSLPPEKKKALSSEAQKLGSEFDSDSKMADFRSEFHTLTEDIGIAND